MYSIAASEAFDAILTKFAETGFFSSSTSPSIFVVYAHDNEKEGLSHAHSARQLIRWLRAIRSRTLSDKFPLPLSTPRNDGHEAIRNILSNQFCLLPFHDFEDGSRTIHSVDKVLVCGSEVLQHYFENSFTSSYIDSIEASYTKLVRQLAEPSTIKTRIRDVVEVESCHHAFHHVITELAFLKLRSAQRRKHHGIIPVSLNGDLMSYLSFEPFQNNCDLVMKLKSPGTAHLRLLFFDLLKQIYPEHHVMIQHFQECYDRIIKTHLNEGTVRETKLDELVRQELMRTSDAVARDQNAVLRDGYFDAGEPPLFYVIASHSNYNYRNLSSLSQNARFRYIHEKVKIARRAFHSTVPGPQRQKPGACRGYMRMVHTSWSISTLATPRNGQPALGLRRPRVR